MYLMNQQEGNLGRSVSQFFHDRILTPSEGRDGGKKRENLLTSGRPRILLTRSGKFSAKTHSGRHVI